MFPKEYSKANKTEKIFALNTEFNSNISVVLSVLMIHTWKLMMRK